MKTIIIISPESWGQNFVSKHHYANNLAKQNIVYFINPPSNFRRSKMAIRIKEKSSNLNIIDYSNLVPKLDLLPIRLQQLIYRMQIKKIKSQLNLDSIDLVWSFDPSRFFVQSDWKARKTIYHTVDYHSCQNLECEIIKSSNYVFSVSKQIMDKIGIAKNEYHIIQHGVETENFKQFNKKTGAKIKACMVANFREIIDYNLLEHLCSKNLNVTFEFIGPTHDSNLGKNDHSSLDELETLKSLSNVSFLGPKQSSELPELIINSDICLLAYNITITNSHKLMEYFRSGNVILSTPISDFKEAKEPLIFIEPNHEAFLKRFKYIIENLNSINSTKLSCHRIQIAENNSYSNKIKEIFAYCDIH